jgi:hypothetical protein
MTRLLWKEYREKRLWLLLLLAGVVGPVIAGQGYTFSGSLDPITPWMFLSIVASFMLGAGAHSSELSGATADFIYSRRVSWKQIAGAKLIVGLGIVVATSLMGAVVYLALCPAPLLRFATMDRLGMGFVYAALFLGGAYLAGLVSSVALPGVFGGVLITLGLLSGMALHAAFLFDIPAMGRHDLFYLLGWAVGPLVSAVITARFGLTLPLRTRLLRYSLIAVLVSAAACQAWFLVPVPSSRHQPKVVFSIISPDQRYAIVNALPSEGRPDGSLDVVRLSDKFRGRVGECISDLYQVSWVDSTTAVIMWSRPSILKIIPAKRLTFKHTLIHQPESAASKEDMVWVPSPDGRLGITAFTRYPGGPSLHNNFVSPDGIWYATSRTDLIQIVDGRSGKPVGPAIRSPKDFWWQSNTEIVYTDANGKRHIVRIVPPEAKQ